MMTFALMLLTLTAGYLMRAYMEREIEVLPAEVKTLVSAMRESEVTAEYYSGVYTVYTDDTREIRWFDSVRIRLIQECGYTVAYVSGATF